MKADLKGLLSNVKSELRLKMRDYYSFALDELYRHLEETVAGEHTIAEFAEHYCIKPAAVAVELPADTERPA